MGARPEPHVSSAVTAARVWLELHAEQLLKAHGPFSTTASGPDHHPDSTVHTLDLIGPTARGRFYLKTLRTDAASTSEKMSQLETEYRVLGDAYQAFATIPELGVVEPVACFPDHLSLLTREAPGTNLSHLLARAARPLSRPRDRHLARRLCHLAGVWLRRFHLLPAPPGSSYDADQLVTYCDHRLRLISDGHAFGLDRPFLASISARVRALIRAIPPGDLQVVGCHYDFRPGNIVTDGRCLVVLDFGGYAPGPRLYDVLKFLTRVDSLASANPGARPFVRGLKDAFTGGYGQPVDFGAPLARLLLTANLLDQLSDLAEARPRTPIRRLQFRWWSHDLVRRLRQVIA